MDRESLLCDLLGQIGDKPSPDTVAKAYLFANFSIQTRLSIHERAYAAFTSRYPNLDAMKDLTIEALEAALRPLGLNLYRAKARAIHAALPMIPAFLEQAWPQSDKDARAWVAEAIPGLGFAKASFFLMLLGRLNVGCLDVHMLKILKTGRKTAPRTRRAYESIERKLGRKAGLRQWLRWIDHMDVPGVGHEVYFASQGVLN